MPQYRNTNAEKAAALNDQASALFQAGTDARETANVYARNAVLFATVLFLVVIAQRFKGFSLRVAANAFAIGLLLLTVVSVATSPRIG
jgi:hypothetical protein